MLTKEYSVPEMTYKHTYSCRHNHDMWRMSHMDRNIHIPRATYDGVFANYFTFDLIQPL